MATERQVQEAVARCVATMVFYHNEAKSRHSAAAMRAELRAASDHLAAIGLEPDRSAECVLRPVKDELSLRYGPALGAKLYNEFTKAFETPTDAGPILTPTQV